MNKIINKQILQFLAFIFGIISISNLAICDIKDIEPEKTKLKTIMPKRSNQPAKKIIKEESGEKN